MASTLNLGNLQHQLGGCLIFPLGSEDDYWASKQKKKKKKKMQAIYSALCLPDL